MLRDAGFSPDSYALLNVAIGKIGDLVWFAVGALIFSLGDVVIRPRPDILPLWISSTNPAPRA